LSLTPKKILLSNSQTMYHVIRKEIIILGNKRLMIMWIMKIGP
jgi:hypothetical protein